MNITIFIGGLSGGGAERVVCNLSNYLSEKHNVTILTMTKDKPRYSINSNIGLVSLYNKKENKGYIYKNLIRYLRLINYVRNKSADVYIVMLPITTILLLSLSNLIKVPIIVSERNDPVERYNKSKIHRFLMSRLYPKASKFVFQTNDSKEFYNRMLSIDGVVIPNAINEDFINYTYSNERTKNIVSIGRFTDQKNFSMLISAFKKITKDFPTYTLEIYGEGLQRKQLENEIDNLKLKNKVSLPGYVDNIADHINSASLFVLPSNYEGMPNALMEAMALGIPCISTDCPIGGPRFLIEDGENGFLFPVGDIETLEEKMRIVLSNSKISQKFSINARKINKKLDHKRIYKIWEECINEVCNIN